MTPSRPPPALHDHQGCIAAALDRAEHLCAGRGARLTTIRRRVLSLVWLSHQPRGAYAILENLAAEEKTKVAPLTIYRALDFLVAQGLVHRIESLNAYVGCPDPGRGHSGQFLVCDGCGTVIELTDPAVSSAIAAGALCQGFTVERPIVEAHGRCAACQAG